MLYVNVCNVMLRVRGQTCPLYNALSLWWAHRQHTKGTTGSRYRSFYKPTKPSQPMMSDDVNDEGRPQHRDSTSSPTLFE